MPAGIAGSVFNVICIQLFGKIYESVAVILNNWEHHRTQTQYEDSQIMKSFVFQVRFEFLFPSRVSPGRLWADIRLACAIQGGEQLLRPVLHRVPQAR